MTYLASQAFRAHNVSLACAPLTQADFPDRWVVTHVLLPFAAVYANGLDARTTMLLVYGWETVELAFSTCVVGAELESVIESIVMDPISGLLGVWFALAACRVVGPSRHATWTTRGVVGLATTLPTLLLWLVHDDAWAIGGCGAAVLVACWASRRRRDATWQPAAVAGVAGVLPLLLVVRDQTNPHYLSLLWFVWGVSVLVAFGDPATQQAGRILGARGVLSK